MFCTVKLLFGQLPKVSRLTGQHRLSIDSMQQDQKQNLDNMGIEEGLKRGSYKTCAIFTVGEAVRPTCGKSDDDDEEEEEVDRFHLSLLQTIL